MLHNGAVALYTPKFAFNHAQLLEICQLQAGANNVMSDEWIGSTNDTIAYYRASQIEACEAIGQIGFKWWKKTTPNKEQAELELIDILHFAISDLLRGTGDAEAVTNAFLNSTHQPLNFFAIGRFAGKTFSGPFFDRDQANPKMSVLNNIQGLPFNDLAEQFQLDCLLNGQSRLQMLYALMDSLAISPLKAHALYVGKNALNNFRTDNGQREGTYCGMWDGREDNEHLYDLLRERISTKTDVSYAEVINYLANQYANAGTLEKK